MQPTKRPASRSNESSSSSQEAAVSWRKKTGGRTRKHTFDNSQKKPGLLFKYIHLPSSLKSKKNSYKFATHASSLCWILLSKPISSSLAGEKVKAASNTEPSAATELHRHKMLYSFVHLQRYFREVSDVKCLKKPGEYHGISHLVPTPWLTTTPMA